MRMVLVARGWKRIRQSPAEAALAEVLTLEVLDVALAGLGVAGEVVEDTNSGFTVDGAEVGAGVG
ncbi:MAG: hypothetical protein ABSH05_23230 [Bryobacteraceae bacterium]